MASGVEKVLLTNAELRQRLEKRWMRSEEFLKSNSPSRKDGVSYEQECQHRRASVRLLESLSSLCYHYYYYNQRKTMRPKDFAWDRHVRAFASACVFYNRFYLQHSHKRFNHYEIALACYILGLKAEDQLFKFRDMIVFMQTVLEWFGMPFAKQMTAHMTETLRESEMTIYATMGFDNFIIHPYVYIEELMSYLIGEGIQLQKIRRKAIEYVTHSFVSHFCLTKDPRRFAVFCISWACREENLPLTNWKGKPESCQMKHWVESFGLKEDDIDTLYAEYRHHRALNDKEVREDILITTELRERRMKDSPVPENTMQLLHARLYLKTDLWDSNPVKKVHEDILAHREWILEENKRERMRISPSVNFAPGPAFDINANSNVMKEWRDFDEMEMEMEMSE